MKFSGYRSGHGFKADRMPSKLGDMICKAGKTTSAIAAGRHLTAIGIEDAHPQVGFTAVLDQDQLVEAHAGAPVE